MATFYKKRKLMQGSSTNASIKGVTRSEGHLSPYMPRVAGKEVKYFDKVLTEEDTGTAIWSSVVSLTEGLAQGATVNERVGFKMFPKKLHLSGLLRAHTSKVTSAGMVSAPAGIAVRLLVVQDTQTNGAAMTAAQLLSTVATISPYKPDTSKRFKIFHDKVYICKSFPVAGYEPVGANFEQTWNYVYQNIKLDLDIKDTVMWAAGDDSGAIANVMSNNYYFIIVADAHSRDNEKSFRGRSRIYFTD